MHAVENNIVNNEAKLKNTDENSSYTSILNTALNSTTTKKYNDANNRFFYTVGNLNLLIEADLKVENISGVNINKVPHASEWCSGIVSVRGIIIPVVDTHILFKDNLDKIYSDKKPHLLMIEHSNHAPIILKIDKLPEIINIEDYTYAKSDKNSPTWQIKTWENSKKKLIEINHNIIFNTIKTA